MINCILLGIAFLFWWIIFSLITCIVMAPVVKERNTCIQVLMICVQCNWTPQDILSLPSSTRDNVFSHECFDNCSTFNGSVVKFKNTETPLTMFCASFNYLYKEFIISTLTWIFQCNPDFLHYILDEFQGKMCPKTLSFFKKSAILLFHNRWSVARKITIFYWNKTEFSFPAETSHVSYSFWS